MDRKLKVFALLLCTLALFVIGCKKDDPVEQPEVVDFDRGALLIQLAGDIQQAYDAYLQDLNTLRSSLVQFETSPTSSELQACRATWRTALLNWQAVAPYGFGPAELANLEASNNIYPIDASNIENNITNGGYDLNSALNVASVGLQAIDYLLHGIGVTDQEILDAYSTAPDKAQRHQYLLDVCDQMINKVSPIRALWQPGTTYRNDFIANDGTGQGSSLGLFLNAFNRTYETNTRTKKLGTPAGALTFSMQPNPGHVEAFYENNNSLAYLTRSLEVYREIYQGGSMDGVGLDDYLEFIGASHHGTSLDQTIEQQLSIALASVASLQDPLSDLVVNDQQAALDTYAELQELVVLWKVDMMSSLGVLITYVDNDGD